MVDFLKSNPYISRDEYMWEWTIPQLQLAANDFTHVRYLSDKEIKRRKKFAKTKKYDNPQDLINDLNIPIF